MAGNRRTVIAGGDELFEAQLVEVGCEILEEVALKRVVAVAIHNLGAEGVRIELQVRLDLFLDINVLGIELILLGRSRCVQSSARGTTHM